MCSRSPRGAANQVPVEAREACDGTSSGPPAGVASWEVMPIPPRPARPRRQSRLALAVLLAAVGLAACAWPFRARWWGGWVLAVREAGIVGGVGGRVRG